VGVAAQVLQDGVGSDDGAFGEDDPAASAHLAQQGREGAGVLEGLELSMELEFAGGVELEQPGAELGPEHMAHRVDREEPAGLFGTGPGVLGGEAAAGDQAMEVGMVHEVLAQVWRMAVRPSSAWKRLLAELEERGAGALKEQAIERGLVLEDERGARRRAGEDPVEIADGQERAPLLLEPYGGCAGAGRKGSGGRPQPWGRQWVAVTLLAAATPSSPVVRSDTGQTAQHLEVMSGQGLAVEVFGQEYFNTWATVNSGAGPEWQLMPGISGT